MSTTRGAIRAAAADLCGLLLASGTATGGTASTLVDVSTTNGGLLSNIDSDQNYVGAYLLMTSGTELGKWREISSYAPLTGTLSLTGNGFSTGPSNGDTYEIYAGLNPDQWSLSNTPKPSIVDAALKRALYLTKECLTRCPDGSMEASGTTSWATTSNASVAKSTSDAITSGTQSLVVTNSGAGGYVQGANINVRPGSAGQVYACYRGTTTTLSTASLQVRDVTNNALIVTAQDIDSGVNFDGGMVSTGFTVPSTCYRIAIRLIGAEAAAVIAWDDVIVTLNDRRTYPLPSWVVKEANVQDLLMRSGNRPFAFDFISVGGPLDLDSDPTAVNTFMVNLPRGIGNSPVYVWGERPFGPMSAVADATVCTGDLEWLATEAASEAMTSYSKEIEQASQARITADRKDIAKALIALRRQWMPWQTKQRPIRQRHPWVGGWGANGSFQLPS